MYVFYLTYTTWLAYGPVYNLGAGGNHDEQEIMDRSGCAIVYGLDRERLGRTSLPVVG